MSKSNLAKKHLMATCIKQARIAFGLVLPSNLEFWTNTGRDAPLIVASKFVHPAQLHIFDDYAAIIQAIKNNKIGVIRADLSISESKCGDMAKADEAMTMAYHLTADILRMIGLANPSALVSVRLPETDYKVVYDRLVRMPKLKKVMTRKHWTTMVFGDTDMPTSTLVCINEVPHVGTISPDQTYED